MSIATRNVTAQSDTAATPARAAQLARVGVLLVAGLVIAFSATLHEQIAFDRTVVAASLAAIAIVHAATWFAARAPHRTLATLLLAVFAAAGAIAAISMETALGVAIVLAAWALASALLEFIAVTIGAAPGATSRSDGVFMGALGVLLALLVLLTRNDAVATLGFFGAYAITAAVFLGISAFDTRSSEAAPTEPAAADR